MMQNTIIHYMYTCYLLFHVSCNVLFSAIYGSIYIRPVVFETFSPESIFEVRLGYFLVSQGFEKEH